MESQIPVLSLIVAALAVFVGPIISWLIAKRQIKASSDLAAEQIHTTLASANKQIVAPMRQAWINSLRDLLAEFLSSAHHYFVAGFDDREDTEYQRIALLRHKIGLMLNPNEQDHVRLEELVGRLIYILETDSEAGRREFPNLHGETTALTRTILKREWNRVKDPIAPLKAETDA
jgi:hypothetical protein